VGEDGGVQESIGLVEDLFRREHAHLVSALTRTLGPANLALAEDVVQDALVSAMQAWPSGRPVTRRRGSSERLGTEPSTSSAANAAACPCCPSWRA
jgi:hypothetical protein